MELININDASIGKFLGVTYNKIKLRDKITGFPLQIQNGEINNDENDLILFYLPIINSKTNYDKNLCNFIKEIGIYEDLFFEDLSNKKLKEEIESLDDEDLDKISKYTFKHFWNYQLNLHEDQINLINEKINLTYEFRKNFINFSDNSTNFLNHLPSEFTNKILNIINKGEFKSDAEYLRGCINDVWGSKDYELEIFNKGTFLNTLYECNHNGMGKGEAVAAYLIHNSIINGSSESFDLYCISDKKTAEIKSMPDLYSSYRIGVKGGIGILRSYKNIVATIELIKEIFNHPGEEYFKQYVSNSFYIFTKQLINEIAQKVYKGEISRLRLKRIELWLFMAHSELYKLNHNHAVKQNVLTREFESEGNLLKALEHLRYVKDPLLLYEDITNDINDFFNVDYLMVFDEKRKMISIVTSPEELTIDGISQNNLKIIEKRCKPEKKNIELEVYKIWKKDKMLDYYDLCINYEKKLLNNC